MTESNATLLRVDGSDLDVVNDARVSFGKESKELTPQDERLIHFLARGTTQAAYEDMVSRLVASKSGAEVEYWLKVWRNTPVHHAPFCGVGAKFHVEAPLFVARQLWKTHIGVASQDENLSWSEVSRRYVEDEPEFYNFLWRKRAPDKKQGSGRIAYEQVELDDDYDLSVSKARETYQEFLLCDVAPEQARAVLPQSTMVEWRWTGSLLSFVRVIKLRTRSDAQKESKEVVDLMASSLSEAFPVSFEALMRY